MQKAANIRKDFMHGSLVLMPQKSGFSASFFRIIINHDRKKMDPQVKSFLILLRKSSIHKSGDLHAIGC
jgi:hypothetical protein